MKDVLESIIESIIRQGAFKKDYPKKGVTFLEISHLVKESSLRNRVAKVTMDALKAQSFDGIAPIASRGYIFSGMIENSLSDVGEYLIQKVKAKGDVRYVQLETKTEYSSDALQILKGSIEKGKKYIIIDDLCATGGSIKTAIALIKQCGGQVETAFVFTELLDFGAKEALAKEGVNLISLLKLTDADLQHLLTLQTAYQNNPKVPISYKLSHHSKGESELRVFNQDTTPLTVHLASTSALKKEATELALKGILDPLPTKIITHDAKSRVNEQPTGHETYEGARNRLQWLEENIPDIDSAIKVSIENGIRFDEATNTHYDVAHVIVKKGALSVTYSDDCTEIPAEIIAAIHKKPDGSYLETWGEAAKRLGLVDDASNPHQAGAFGGISRTTHLTRILCKAVGDLKAKVIAKQSPVFEEKSFAINRLLELHDKHSTEKYSEMGIRFPSMTDSIKSRPINLYNQGAPLRTWGVSAQKVARNSFKVFQTGDPFSIISPDVEIAGANIHIHVGLEHPSYSASVLIQEALQLCRNAYEHGARSVTVSLPDTFHPIANYNELNVLLMKLFKASGANRAYFYDKEYTGKLEEPNLRATIPLTIGSQSDKTHYQLAVADLRDALKFPKASSAFAEGYSIDDKIMHFTRRADFKKLWSDVDESQTDILTALSDNALLTSLRIPDITFRPHILLCCHANKPLAEKIAARLRQQGEMVRLYHIEGEGSEARIPHDALICGSTVTIVQSTHPSPDDFIASKEYETNGSSAYFFEAMMIAREAKHRGASTVNLINPYQFSARSDKAEDSPNGRTGSYVQQNGLLLKASGVNQVITAECHDTHTMSGTYTGGNMRSSAVSALSVISAKLAEAWLNDTERPMEAQLRLVTPDAGAAKRTKELTQQLRAILGHRLCEQRVLGEKERDSHRDTSALLTSLNLGEIAINHQDKYLITDDETATGSTLCQAIRNLREKGAIDISVIVVHNNMPLNWLKRQLCLARFLHMGVSDLHFSDTHEMGQLATSYEMLISHYSAQSGLPPSEVEEEVLLWFKKNIVAKLADKSDEIVGQAFSQFKAMFGQFDSKIKVHSLANEFANKVKTQAYMCNSHAFAHQVDEYISLIQTQGLQHIAVFEGASLPAASAAAQQLKLPLHIIHEIMPDSASKNLTLPPPPFALIGTPSDLTFNTLVRQTGYNPENLMPMNTQGLHGDITVVSNKPSMTPLLDTCKLVPSPAFKIKIDESLQTVTALFQGIKARKTISDSKVTFLAIGVKGQALAGQLSYLLHKEGIHVGIACVEDNSTLHRDMVVYKGQSREHKLTVDRNSLRMGEVCIAVGGDLTEDISHAIAKLTSDAKVDCPCHCAVSPSGSLRVSDITPKRTALPHVHSAQVPSLFFQSTTKTTLNAAPAGDKACMLP